MNQVVDGNSEPSCKQECIPVGYVPSATVAVCRGVPGPGGACSRGGAWSGGCLLRRVPGPGGCMVWVVSAPGGRVVSQHALRQTHCELNDRQV